MKKILFLLSNKAGDFNIYAVFQIKANKIRKILSVFLHNFK